MQAEANRKVVRQSTGRQWRPRTPTLIMSQQQIAALVAERRGTVRRILGLEGVVAALLRRKKPETIEQLQNEIVSLRARVRVTRSDNIKMPPNAQPASTAPKQREITCVHEAGHAVVGHWLFGAVGGRASQSGRRGCMV